MKLVKVFAYIIFTVFAWHTSRSQSGVDNSEMSNKIIEIRTYNLRPGVREEFHKLVLTKSLPMLYRWKVEVVAFGPSLHDADSYFLIRAYKDLDDLKKSEDAFYGSDEWRKGPRESIMTLILNYTTFVIPANAELIDQLQKTNQIPFK